MKKIIFKIMFWSAVALVVPFLGNYFVEGWNWGWSEFIFAWIFWTVMASSIVFAVKHFSNYRFIVGTLVFFFFAFIWVMLATG
jgi:hypothetical protein